MTALYYMIAFLFGVIFGQSIMHYFERKDLYNRIQSKDLSDFTANTKKIPPIKTKKPPEYISL